ncbi:MAG: type II secretion system F family protein [Candidatus Aenigmarchaeota archaeon]|nr:type II secretion system F family protein [Candidatus Aenigmarchaeota archaeon]
MIEKLKKYLPKATDENSIAIYPMMIALLLLIIGIFFVKTETGSPDIGVIGNLVFLSILVIIGPYLIKKYLDYSWIKSLEEQFPSFLRDLAESQRSGMNLIQALSSAADSNYGKLTPEIRSIVNHYTWGVPFERIVEIFISRTKNSELMTRSMRIIKEAYASGGNITLTLESVAKDVAVIKDAEKERKTALGQHVAIMYAIFFMFLIIVLALTKILIPMFKQQSLSLSGSTDFGFSDPCKLCTGLKADLNCTPCSIYGVVCSMFGINAGVGCYYTALFFSMLMLQGVFGGLVAGQISENSVTSGLKHSMIMTGVGFATFSILIRLGFLGL